METKEILKEEILDIPILNMLFSDEDYAFYLDNFIQDINRGSKIEGKKAIIILLNAYFNYSGKDFCKMSAFYFYLSIYILINYKFETDKEKRKYYISHYWEYKDLFYYSQYDLAKVGSTLYLNYEYVEYCFKLLTILPLNDEIRAVFSYGIFLYVNKTQPLISCNEITEQKPILRISDKIKLKKKKINQISREDILEVPVFKMIFSKTEFESFLDDFTFDINRGCQIDEEQTIMILLTTCLNSTYDEYIDKMVFYFYLSAFILENYIYKLEENENLKYCFYLEYKELFFYLGKENEKLDIIYFSHLNYIEECMSLFKNKLSDKTSRSVFNYSLFLFVKNIYPVISQIRLKETLNLN